MPLQQFDPVLEPDKALQMEAWAKFEALAMRLGVSTAEVVGVALRLVEDVAPMAAAMAAAPRPAATWPAKLEVRNDRQ